MPAPVTSPRAAPARPAFTLMEVLVVLFLMFILGSLLFPASAPIRMNSKQSRCLANLMQVSYANTIYGANDPAGMALPVHPSLFAQNVADPVYFGAYEWGGKSGVGERDSDSLTSSLWGTSRGLGPARRPLNSILYGKGLPDYTNDPGPGEANWLADTQAPLDIYHCPSDVGYTGIHSRPFRDEHRTSYDHFGTSYGANNYFNGITGDGSVFSNGPLLHRLADIVAPAETLAFQENNGRFAWSSREEPECAFLGKGFPGPVRGWHGKDWTFNAAFIDGHADIIYMNGYRNDDVVHYPPDGDSDQVNLAQNYRCIIIRGDGWRKDTLPLPFVDAPLISALPRPSWERGIE